MHRIGCQVYLDDFGAGFSTFSYLRHINADALKFDGQFIVNLSNDYENQIFVRSMVTIAKGLGKKTVAEFVEDADTLALLGELGVDMAQGYYIHKPSAQINSTPTTPKRTLSLVNING
ncbi:MAG: EAL domain-containing protein, partial [Methylophagaceae bacterium]